MAKDLTRAEATRLLREIGFPLPKRPSAKQAHEAIADFQRGFTFWKLAPDGFAGPKTSRAIRYSANHGGKCSPNFTFREFASKGNQDWTIKLQRELVLGLEELRDEVGPIGVLSGYRDPAHNASVGSTPNSQHLYGSAIDPNPPLPLAAVLKVRRFSGIGIDRSSGKVRHVDVRGQGSAPDTTGGTVEDPTRWFYA